MFWRAYFAAFSIRSPIHVGYHSISHENRTRYYIPGKNMMGAFADSLNEENGGINTGILQKVRDTFLFTTFFVSKNGRDALFPVLTENGDLHYGKEGMPLWDFINQFISSKEGYKYSLEKTVSEMEFIVPKNNVKKTQNFLVGYIFAAGDFEERGVGAWLRALRNLSIGEVTDNQLGNVELIFLEKLQGEDCRAPFFAVPGVYLDWSGKEVVVEYQKPAPLLGYLRSDAYSSFSIYGVQESMEGSFDLLKGLSTEVTANKCWVPGTLVTPAESGTSFIMGYDGVWSTKTGAEQE
ncbi:MAG TPA: hypothetical protein GX691_05985 [Clostridia bacterium]|jgi:hypothetical protein|nr:hypothetical protein [Clostridia bacterium]